MERGPESGGPLTKITQIKDFVRPDSPIQQEIKPTNEDVRLGQELADFYEQNEIREGVIW